MNKKIARIALLGVAVMMFLVATGCGSDSSGEGGKNLTPQLKAGAKAGHKHDPSGFVSTE